MNYKYELGNPLTDEIIEDIRKEAQKETLKWWINAFEQGAYGSKDAIELMKDQLVSLETTTTERKDK